MLTDATLFALHMYCDNILKDVELNVIIDTLKSMLNKMYAGIPNLASDYSNNPSMTQMLKVADFYLNVSLNLLGQQVSPYYSDNTSKINNVISKIMSSSGIGEDTLLSSIRVLYDWSQFTPRGHYDDQNLPILANYFRTMMWLGRTEVYLLMLRANTTAYSIEVYNSLQRYIHFR